MHHLSRSSFIMLYVSSAWNRRPRWRHTIKTAFSCWAQALPVIRVSSYTLRSRSHCSVTLSISNFLFLSSPFLTQGKTWCGWWWIKSSRALRLNSTVSSLWVTRLTASTPSTCWWRWAITCGQLRTSILPPTSALLWEMCWSLSKGTLTNALWGEF